MEPGSHTDVVTELRFDRMMSWTCCFSNSCIALQGVRDDVVDISAGRALHAAALNPVEPLWAQNCDHQNVEMDPNYVTRLKEFVRQIFK